MHIYILIVFDIVINLFVLTIDLIIFRVVVLDLFMFVYYIIL